MYYLPTIASRAKIVGEIVVGAKKKLLGIEPISPSESAQNHI
jgi:hypothetical protein